MNKSGYNPEVELVRAIAPLIKERLVTLDEVVEWTKFFFDDFLPVIDDLIGKNMSREESRTVLIKSDTILQKAEPFSFHKYEQELRTMVESSGFNAGQVFGILRMAVTGQKISPPLLESMEILGKTKVLDRIKSAIQVLSSKLRIANNIMLNKNILFS